MHKGDGEPYYKRCLDKEKDMTDSEREEQAKWWKETQRKFRIIGEDNGANDSTKGNWVFKINQW